MSRWVAILIVAGCGRLGFDSRTPPDDAATDTTGRVDWTAWSAPVHIATVASDVYEWEPAIHPDKLVLVFTRTPASLTTSDLFVTTRPNVGADFGPPVQLGFSQASDGGAAWTPDGKQLVFTSSRSGFERLYTVGFNGTDFGTPAIIPELANEDARSPAVSADGLELYYSDTDKLDSKIRRAHRTSLTAAWQVDGVVAGIDSPQNDGWPTLSPDGLALLFESSRDSIDAFIYCATRPSVDAAFSNVTKVTAIDDGTASGDPEISADGSMIFFGAQRSDSVGNQDLYFATRQ